jgi:prepilin-type N-terminal cleavage/methylation domain-containing protein
MMRIKLKNKSGFTLLELMLVMAILAIIAFVSRDLYTNFALDATIDNNSKTIMFDLRSARNRAMNGQDDYNWGIHFVNSASDYYEIFSTPTNYASASTTIESTNYLNGNITFSSPANGNSIDIIFTKISGLATATDIIIISGTNQRTISVKSQGLIN